MSPAIGWRSAARLRRRGGTGKRQASSAPSPRPIWPPTAGYERGKALIRAGETARGRVVLREVARRWPRDTAAARALFLLADLSRDAGNYQEARGLWREVVTRFPASEPASRAGFLAALVEFTGGRYAEAAAEWDSLAPIAEGSEEEPAARYWAGRAWQMLGDTLNARQRWDSVARGFPLSYYGALAARQIGRPRTEWTAGPDAFPEMSDLSDAQARLDLLTQAGLGDEIPLERRWLTSQAGDDVPRLVATADLMRAQGWAMAASQLGWRALRQGAAEPRTYRLIFPLLFRDLLRDASRGHDVEPALVAALIRQESGFDSMATSRAGARGLMQIMPAVGRILARGAGLSPWHPDSLYLAARNLELGTSQLAAVQRDEQRLERTLAAYNAGGSRVVRWSRLPGAGDPEIFVEWIPFLETRAYVRSVLRNLELYRALYEW